MIYTLMTWSILPVSMSEKCVAGGSVVVEILMSLLKSHWWSSVVTRKHPPLRCHLLPLPLVNIYVF